MAYSVLSYRILKNEQTLVGSTIQREQVVRIYCVCDTVADLPPIDLVTVPEGTMRLAAGSRAHIISTSADYMLDSAGNWIQQLPPSAAATYTKQEIDAMIEDIDDNLADLQQDLADIRTDIATDRSVLADLIDSGSKNIMPLANPLASETKRGVTATYDFIAGTITLNGIHDATGDAVFYLYTGSAADATPIPAGSYHLSGCPAGGSTDTYCLIVNNVGGTPSYKLDTGIGQSFTISEPGHMAPFIRIRTPAGQTVSFDNVIFRPMICTQAAWKDSQQFAPYVPTLADLYRLVKSYHP